MSDDKGAGPDRKLPALILVDKITLGVFMVKNSCLECKFLNLNFLRSVFLLHLAFPLKKDIAISLP